MCIAQFVSKPKKKMVFQIKQQPEEGFIFVKLASFRWEGSGDLPTLLLIFRSFETCVLGATQVA